jgi:hypothetical protein
MSSLVKENMGWAASVEERCCMPQLGRSVVGTR